MTPDRYYGPLPDQLGPAQRPAGQQSLIAVWLVCATNGLLQCIPRDNTDTFVRDFTEHAHLQLFKSNEVSRLVNVIWVIA